MTALVGKPSRSAAVLERLFALADQGPFVPLIVRGDCQRRIVLLVVRGEFGEWGLFTLRFEGLRLASGRTATGGSEGRLVCDGRLDRSLRQSIARFPVLTQPVHGFAQAHRERRDRLKPLLSAIRELPVIFPPDLREQQLRVAKNSRERIVQLVPQHLAKRVGRRVFKRGGRQRNTQKFRRLL